MFRTNASRVAAARVAPEAEAVTGEPGGKVAPGAEAAMAVEAVTAAKVGRPASGVSPGRAAQAASQCVAANPVSPGSRASRANRGRLASPSPDVHEELEAPVERSHS